MTVDGRVMRAVDGLMDSVTKAGGSVVLVLLDKSDEGVATVPYAQFNGPDRVVSTALKVVAANIDKGQRVGRPGDWTHVPVNREIN